MIRWLGILIPVCQLFLVWTIFLYQYQGVSTYDPTIKDTGFSVWGLTSHVNLSYRKPRPVPQLVTQQVNPQFALPSPPPPQPPPPPPTLPKKEKKEKAEKEKNEKEPTLKKNNNKTMR